MTELVLKIDQSGMSHMDFGSLPSNCKKFRVLSYLKGTRWNSLILKKRKADF